MTDSHRESVSSDDTTRRLLRHVIATIAYRGSKVLRDAPAGFDTFSLSPSTRQPVLIVTHLGDLMDWALTAAKAGGTFAWKASGSRGWSDDVGSSLRSPHSMSISHLASPSAIQPKNSFRDR